VGDVEGYVMSSQPVMSGTADGPHLEVEVKFLVDDLDAVRARLVEHGATQQSPRTYERNIRFDTPSGALLAEAKLLRLRQDARVRLTFKGRAAADAASEAKVREEIEVTLDDFDNMALILQRLDFEPVQMYEKYRETFRLGEVEVVLDEMPFGLFVELEGPEAALRPMAESLQFDWSRRILVNYLAMMAFFKQIYRLPFDDITFDGFAQHPISPRVIYDYTGPDAT
jgi:adenylate cyclase class 2